MDQDPHDRESLFWLVPFQLLSSVLEHPRFEASFFFSHYLFGFARVPFPGLVRIGCPLYACVRFAMAPVSSPFPAVQGLKSLTCLQFLVPPAFLKNGSFTTLFFFSDFRSVLLLRFSPPPHRAFLFILSSILYCFRRSSYCFGQRFG